MVDPDVLWYYALNGQDALDKLESQEIAVPDIIFLDMKMPVMGGTKFLELIRQHEKFAEIPVIIYSEKNTLREGMMISSGYQESYIVQLFFFAVVTFFGLR